MVSLRRAITWLTARRILLLVLATSIAVVLVIVVVARRESPQPDESVSEPAPPVASAAPIATPSPPASADVGSARWALGLLDELEVSDEAAPASEPYERDDYGGWIDADGDCQSTRHEVLIEESVIEVEFADDRGCKVGAGRWVDPYTGDVVTTVEEASIDHVVSLSESHHSGAWAWSDAWKQALSNDLDDPATLAVSFVTVNQAKGSLGPDDWLPETADARCRYVVARVRVKTRWQLSVGSAEQQALERELGTCMRVALPSIPITAPLVRIDFAGDPPEPAPRPTPRITPGVCDPRYPNVCIPQSDDDLNCRDLEIERFEIVGEDPHGFDGNDDGVACEGPP